MTEINNEAEQLCGHSVGGFESRQEGSAKEKEDPKPSEKL